MKTSVAFATRSFLLRLALAGGIVLFCALAIRAGGPKCVAGTENFDPAMTGQPLVWPQGAITYYTDQGDLSPILPNASANNFVAGALSIWTGVPTAALSATSGGALAEDVNGTNVYRNANGTITMPADIQSTATDTPIGVVYDYDGSVTDAFLGAGAGGSSQCFFNAVFGGSDNYGTLAAYQHALIVINGQCAQQPSQLTDVEYRLVRVIGSILGLGWSQANPNVQTGSPHPTSSDYLGFPVMHYIDAMSCVPITACYANPYQLSMDDQAAISRLYPVTAQNQSSFPGKQVFSAATARIHGSVYFTDAPGNRTQPMQGANVVARWIDPSSGQPSRQYVATSVSGFLFSGNEGNPITGFDDATGDPYAEWGSASQSVEGFFDLSGLQLPVGGSAQYQLTVEALDKFWAMGLGPYSPGPVSPSGAATPITLTLTAGNDVQQGILMTGSAQPLPQAASSWTAPAALPSGGDWVSSLSGYGEIAYFLVSAQANRTLSVAITALDESGNASEVKTQPVIGMWAASDLQGTAPPAFTSAPFNQGPFGMTRLDAQVNATSNFLIGISDLRGDGRPDYHYHAHVLYGDSVSPPRIGVNGGAVTVQGTGFASGDSAAIGNTTATQLSVSSGQISVAAPPAGDGLQNITITDPVSGSSTTLTGALTYGAAAADNIVLLGGSNPWTPVGAQASYAVIVRVMAADGVTPVNGATVGWSGTNGVQLSACSGASSCSVTSDQNGDSATWLTAGAPGVATVTATLAPGVYSPSKSVSATLNAIESSSDIGSIMPYVWISQGANASVPLTARALSNGTPRSGAQINFTVVSGSGSLSAASGQTNSSGYATVTLPVTQITASAQISACVAPGKRSVRHFLHQPGATGPTEPAARCRRGTGLNGTSAPARRCQGHGLFFATQPGHGRTGHISHYSAASWRDFFVGWHGRNESRQSCDAVILKVTQNSVTTDINGQASVVPSGAGFSPPVEVDVLITAGNGAFLDEPLQIFPSPPGTSDLAGPLPVRAVGINRPVQAER